MKQHLRKKDRVAHGGASWVSKPPKAKWLRKRDPHKRPTGSVPTK